jgi:hypothetical protein
LRSGSAEDSSEFMDVLEVREAEIDGYKVLRDVTGRTPHCSFGWTKGNPIVYLIRFMLFGEADSAPVTHEVLREAEPNLEKRPAIHVGGR